MKTKSLSLLTAGLIPVLALIVLFILITPCYAADIIVNPGESIQMAIDGAIPGDIILIQPGIYTESLTLNKAVSLVGAGGDTTIIRAASNQRVLTVTGSAIDNTVVISGLTFADGVAPGPLPGPDTGGGILVTGSAQPRIQNVIIRNCRSFWDGGGLYADSPVRLDGVALIDNFSSRKGGGLAAGGPLTVTNGWFEGNRAMGNSTGGLQAYGDLVVSNTVFISNTTTGHGGAIRLEGGSGLLVNVLFVRNTADYYGAAIYAGGATDYVGIFHATIGDSGLNPGQAIYVSGSKLEVFNSIITSHTIGIENSGGEVGEYSNLFFGNVTDTVGTIGGGSSSLFGAAPRFRDPAHDDYHLGPGSAALDNGLDLGVPTDLDGVPRPQGAGSDRGAYEAIMVYLPLVLRNS